MKLIHAIALVPLVAFTSSCTTYEEVRAETQEAEAELEEAKIVLAAFKVSHPSIAAGDVAARDRLVAAIAQKQKVVDNGNDNMKLFGAKFGVAPAMLFGGRTQIGKATVENGTVRVSESTDERAVVLLETHYFPWSFDVGEKSRMGTGPFLALGLESTDSVLNGIGAGWMIGWGAIGKSNTSFNIGLGAYLDPSVDMLAAGFTNGAAPPTGETQARLESKSQMYGLFLASFSWAL